MGISRSFTVKDHTNRVESHPMEEQTFLVALDMKEDATDVMLAARKLADQCSARLVCMTVVPPLVGVYGGLYMLPYAIPTISFEEEALRHAQARLLTLATKHGVNETDVYSRLGSPASEIRAIATELKCDLIIMGTHARSGLNRLLGSTANAVLHGLPCDAHLVKVRSE
jgi:universal stress protein A